MLAAGLGFIVWYFGWLSTEAQDLAYQIPGMLAPIAIIAGVAIYKPDDGRPWVLLADSQVLHGDGGLDVGHPRARSASTCSLHRRWLYLSGQALDCRRGHHLVRGRIPGGDRAGLIDALIVAVGVALLSWTFLMAPLVSDPSASILEIGVALAYPALDVLLLGVLVRIMLAPGRRVPA